MCKVNSPEANYRVSMSEELKIYKNKATAAMMMNRHVELEIYAVRK